ncbi:MAG TPA: helix-turn-helix domain-containing protein [Nitrososphaerales archaeon]|nr:helix-turn-helix domain-containing protein [Nitrososphaerales archaeon]
MIELDDIDTLLDVLGNETRRRILQLLADEPRYFIQLSKDLGVSQQAVLKHLEVLERHGFISSYESESEYAAPKRKYFQLDKSCMLAIGITRDAVEFVFRDLSPHIDEESAEQRELRSTSREVAQLEKEADVVKKLNASDKLLKEINSKLSELTQMEISLLRLKQRITKVAHEAIRESFEDELHRQILYETLGEEKQPDIDELSATLDTREKEISAALRVLKQRLSSS